MRVKWIALGLADLADALFRHEVPVEAPMVEEDENKVPLMIHSASSCYPPGNDHISHLGK